MNLYLDMIGTAVTAIILGSWYGAGVGAATSALAAISNIPGSIAVVGVQIAEALVWGYGVRAWRLGRTPAISAAQRGGFSPASSTPTLIPNPPRMCFGTRHARAPGYPVSQ